MIATLTERTCGEACWHAKEEECHCSCGGRNHGILNRGEEIPVRHCRHNGAIYKLVAVGGWCEMNSERYKIVKQAQEDGHRDSERCPAAYTKTATGAQTRWTEVSGLCTEISVPDLLWVKVR